MTNEPLALGPVSTGSLLTTSEGLLTTTLTGLCGTVLLGEYPDMIKIVALASLAVATAAYSLSRGKAKSS
jgi:hypothetical protein